MRLHCPALLSFVLALPVAGQQSGQTALEELDTLFAAHVSEGRSPGLSIAIVMDGQLAFAKGYGNRSIEEKLPVQTETRFGIASVTKQFTCASIFLLAEAGDLSIHDPVAKYYPYLRRAGEIKLLDLMNHTSGYPDYYPLDFVDQKMAQPIEAETLIERFAGKDVALDFEPGSAYSYSNTGYIILGRIIEKVTGKTFASFLQQRIFDPLGMQNTFYQPNPSNDSFANGYVTFALGPLERNLPEGRGWVSSAGGIWTTPTDLAKWDIALLDGKVVNPESWSVMTRRRRLLNGSLTAYGCGLGLSTRSNREVIAHSGGINGFSSWNGMVPSMGVAIILFSNRSGGLGSLSDQTLEVILRNPPKTHSTPAPQVHGPSTKKIVGTVLAMLQAGKIDRSLFTADFNHYLSEDRLAGAAERLAKFGKPQSLKINTRRERGGMEVSSTKVACKGGNLVVLMYRHTDGRVAQFFVRR